MNFNLRLYILLGVVCSCMSAVDVNAQLYINEILAANNSTNYDSYYYNFSDWIEIYNDGGHSVNLEGYTLSDDINIPENAASELTIMYTLNPTSFVGIPARRAVSILPPTAQTIRP